MQRAFVPAAFVIVASLALLLIVNTALVHAAPRDAFVGTWEVVITPDEASGGGKEIKDTLTFKGMQFSSAHFAKQHAFEPATYEEDTRAGIAATFKAEAKSKTQGTAVWKGQSQANVLSGELAWTKADGSVVNYTFKGERKG